MGGSSRCVVAWCAHDGRYDRVHGLVFIQGVFVSIRTILKMGDPRLLRHAQRVQTFDTVELHQLVADLHDTMAAAQGAGLAASQIGVDLQVVVFGGMGSNPRYPLRAVVEPTVLINPIITPLSAQQDDDLEGCLSIPGLRGMVPRWTHIRYEGYTPDGQRIDRQVEGFHARVVQHECDHLWGRLYPTRMTDLASLGFIDAVTAKDVPA